MDNGRQQKMEQLSAKELTEQINQATDLELAAGAEDQSFAMPGTTREQIQRVGWQVLDGGKNEVINDTEQAPVEADFAAAQEVARDEAELEHPGEFAGDETQLQIDENLARDAENARNEQNPNRSPEAKIAYRGEQKIARVAMHEVESIAGQKSFSPLEIVRLQRDFGNQALNSMENPHPIGRGNG